MPGAPIRVDLRVGCVGQRAVSVPPLVRLGRAVHGRAHERMPEHHRTIQRQQAFRARGVRRCLRDPKLPRGAPQERRVADGFRGRQEHELPRCSCGSRDSRRTKLCSIPVHSGSAAGSPNPPASWAGVNPRGSSMRASGFPPVSAMIRSSTASSSRAARTDSSNARESRRPNGSTRSCGKRANPSPSSRVATDERDPLRLQAACHEPERSRRGVVEPLGVVDDAQQGLLLGCTGQEAENCEADE